MTGEAQGISEQARQRIRADLASTQIDTRADEVCCPGWWYEVVRHVCRNMDIECGTHGEYGPKYDEDRDCGPQRYDGEPIARLLAAVPALLAALADRDRELAELRAKIAAEIRAEHTHTDSACDVCVGLEAAAQIAAEPIVRQSIVEALSPIHHPWTPDDGRAEYCVDDGEPWPCPTVRIAGGVTALKSEGSSFNRGYDAGYRAAEERLTLARTVTAARLRTFADSLDSLADPATPIEAPHGIMVPLPAYDVLAAALADRDRELAELRRDPRANAMVLWMHRADAAEAELAELRAKIAELATDPPHECGDVCIEFGCDDRGAVHLVLRSTLRELLASSGSAPTGQEER